MTLQKQDTLTRKIRGFFVLLSLSVFVRCHGEPHDNNAFLRNINPWTFSNTAFSAAGKSLFTMSTSEPD